MHNDYKCTVKINFENGDVTIEVLGGGQTFSYNSGLGFLALPEFFVALSRLYKGEANKIKLEYHGTFECYSYYFSSDGKSLKVKHIDPFTDKMVYYIFDLKQYVKVVDKGFSEYLQHYRSEGSFPLNFDELLNPLGETVKKYFYDFSLLINDRI